MPTSQESEPVTPDRTVPRAEPSESPVPRQRLRWFGGFVGLLTLAFALPLLEMVRYSLATELHSHAILIPAISLWLIWTRRSENLPPIGSSLALAVVPLAVGLAALKVGWSPADAASVLKINDRLAATSFAYVCCLWSGALAFLGWQFVCRWAFPLAFLVFLVPMPTLVENALEVFFQHASADATAILFSLTGMTYFRDGLVFDLPGISIRVAQECSGIRSSLVLFITSLLAGHMFLRSPWRRFSLTVFVVPLAIVRNAIRIVTISMLCVYKDPSMIDSWIHRRGGPFFFALSLIPFFLLLLWLQRSEARRASSAGLGSKGSE